MKSKLLKQHYSLTFIHIIDPGVPFTKTRTFGDNNALDITLERKWRSSFLMVGSFCFESGYYVSC